MLLLVGSLEELSLLCKIIQYQMAICTEFSLVGVCTHLTFSPVLPVFLSWDEVLSNTRGRKSNMWQPALDPYK